MTSNTSCAKNPYLAIFKMYVINEMTYRGKVLLGMSTQVFWGLMYVLMYTAFYATGNSPSGFSLTELTSYIWLGQAFFVFRYIGRDARVTDSIIKGDVAYEFIRPLDLYNCWYAKNLAEKLVGTALRGAPILLLGFLLPVGLGLMLPTSLSAFLLFCLSLIIGLMLAVGINMFINILTFKTMSPRGIAGMVSVVTGLLGGYYIPLPLMPAGIRAVLDYLPFRYISDLPYRIYVGAIDAPNAIIFILIQIFWLAVILFTGRLLLKSCLKNVEVQGG